MKRTAFAVLFCVAVLPLSAAAGSTDVAQQIARLEKAYETLQDMQAAFQQETVSGAVAVVQQATGRVYFKKQGKMLWKYETPEEQHIILDGTTLWFYQPEEKQAMKNNFTVVPQHIVVDLFRGRIDILQRYRAAAVAPDPEDTSGFLVIELAPIEHDPMLSRLVLWLDPESFLVRKTALFDAFGNRTDLAFSDIKVDQSLPDSLFAFTPPPGVDVFEPPQLQTPQP